MSATSLDTQERLDQPVPAVQEAGAATAAPAPPARPNDQHMPDEHVPDDVHVPGTDVPDEQTPEPEAGAADDLARAVAERDEYLDALQRLQAEYDNYRRRMQRELSDAGDRGGRQVAERLLETLDTFDAAVSHGVDALVPLRRSLQDALAGAGLQRIEPTGEPFDPADHHAVAHDPADDAEPAMSADAQPAVVEVLRPGYRWKGRLVRPALVHVKG